MEDKEQRQLDRRETCGVPALAGLCNPVRGKMFVAEWDMFTPDFENRHVHGQRDSTSATKLIRIAELIIAVILEEIYCKKRTSLRSTK